MIALGLLLLRLAGQGDHEGQEQREGRNADVDHLLFRNSIPLQSPLLFGFGW